MAPGDIDLLHHGVNVPGEHGLHEAFDHGAGKRIALVLVGVKRRNDCRKQQEHRRKSHEVSPEVTSIVTGERALEQE
jgi:hypothetical protein